MGLVKASGQHHNSKILLREKLIQKDNEKIEMFEKVRDDFQKSMKRRIRENIEETIQEELADNLNEDQNDLNESSRVESRQLFQDLNLLVENQDLTDIVLTAGQSKTGLVNDPAENLPTKSGDTNREYEPNIEVQPYYHQRYKPERGSYYGRPRRPRGFRGRPRGRGIRGSVRSRRRSYGGSPRSNYRGHGYF